MSESNIIDFPVDEVRARLSLQDTAVRDYSVVEWSPRGIAIELPIREILVWPNERYSEPEITTLYIS